MPTPTVTDQVLASRGMDRAEFEGRYEAARKPQPAATAKPRTAQPEPKQPPVPRREDFRDERSYMEARAIAAQGGLGATPPPAPPPSLWPKICSAGPVKKAILDARVALEAFERDYKKLVPVLDHRRQLKVETNRLGGLRDADKIVAGANDLASLDPEAHRAAVHAAHGTVQRHAEIVLAKIGVAVAAAQAELDRLSKDAAKDEAEFSRKWGVTLNPGPVSALIAKLRDHAVNIGAKPVGTVRGPGELRGKLAHLSV